MSCDGDSRAVVARFRHRQHWQHLMRVIEMDVCRRRRRHANISSITDGRRIDSVTGWTQPAEHGAVYCRLHVDAERRMPLGRLFYNTSPQSPHHTLCRQQRREADI